MTITEQERLRRWRLVLGKQAEKGMAGTGAGAPGDGQGMLSGRDLGMDKTLEALYDAQRSGGLGGPRPT